MPSSIHFSCAIPIRRWHPFLPAALSSLADQNMPLEVALLDASNDPRVSEAADNAQLNFAYRRTGPDTGQAAAIAEGWRKTKGDVLFWLNADDRLAPNTLTLVADEFLSDDSSDVVFGGSDFIDIEERLTGHHAQVADVSELLLRSNTISQPSCFSRRSAVERVGGLDESLHYTMDWELWVRLYLDGRQFKRIENILSIVYMGNDTKTGSLAARRAGEVFRLVKKNAGVWAAIKATFALTMETLIRRGSS